MTTKDKTLGDLIAAIPPGVRTERASGISLADQTKRMIADLSPKERELLNHRFGGAEKVDDIMKEGDINHPSHYLASSGIEVIDAIEAWDLGFNLGNAVKYIARAAHKGSRDEDLKKARWYLEREITRNGKS